MKPVRNINIEKYFNGNKKLIKKDKKYKKINPNVKSKLFMSF